MQQISRSLRNHILFQSLRQVLKLCNISLCRPTTAQSVKFRFIRPCILCGVARCTSFTVLLVLLYRDVWRAKPVWRTLVGRSNLVNPTLYLGVSFLIVHHTSLVLINRNVLLPKPKTLKHEGQITCMPISILVHLLL